MRIKLALAVFAAWVVWVVVSSTIVVPVHTAQAGLFKYNVTPVPSATSTATATATPTP